MLVGVLMIFVIFSFTGVAVLNVSYLSSSASMETTNNIRLQYEIESRINESLWRINAGADTLVNYTIDGASVFWDSQLSILSVDVNKFDMEAEILLDLSHDTPFSSAIASVNPINFDAYQALAEEEHAVQEFDVMPNVDYDWFLTNHTHIYHGNQSSWSEEDLATEGIHIFLGNNLEISGLNLENSTLVFLGNDIQFSTNNIIKAPVPADSVDATPAIVFMNPYTSLTIGEGTHVEGAIYCAGRLFLEDATLSGPIVSKDVTLNDDVDFIDDLHPQYYRWNKGFGNKKDYDWPKHIDRWRTVKWDRITGDA